MDRCRILDNSRLMRRPHVFEVQTPAKVFFIQCADDRERTDWVAALRQNMRVSELETSETLFKQVERAGRCCLLPLVPPSLVT